MSSNYFAFGNPPFFVLADCDGHGPLAWARCIHSMRDRAPGWGKGKDGRRDHAVKTTIHAHSQHFVCHLTCVATMETPRFSYQEPCVAAWELSRELRRRGIQGKPLVENSRDDDGEAAVLPTLPNLRRNYTLLKAYTSTMAKTGTMLTSRISYIGEPITAFYELMGLTVTSQAGKSLCYGNSYIVKRMLSAIRRKWARWEMPRVAEPEKYHLILGVLFR